MKIMINKLNNVIVAYGSTMIRKVKKDLFKLEKINSNRKTAIENMKDFQVIDCSISLYRAIKNNDKKYIELNSVYSLEY